MMVKPRQTQNFIPQAWIVILDPLLLHLKLRAAIHKTRRDQNLHWKHQRQRLMETPQNKVSLCMEFLRSITYGLEVSDTDAHGRRKLGGALRAYKSEMRKLHHLQDQTFRIFTWLGKRAKSCPLQPFSNPLMELQRIGAGRSNQLSKSPGKKKSTWLHFLNGNKREKRSDGEDL